MQVLPGERSGAISLGNNGTSAPLLCRVTVISTLLDPSGGEEEGTDSNSTGTSEGSEVNERVYGCIPIVRDEEKGQPLLHLPHLPESIIKGNEGEIPTGALLVEIVGASIDEDEQAVVGGESADYRIVDVNAAGRDRLRRHLLKLSTASKGKKTLFIVRVSTPDSKVDYSLSAIHRTVFHKDVSLKTQFEACSFGKLQFESAGGIDVMLDESISAFQRPNQIVSAAEKKVKSMLKVDAMDDLADRIIFCQPPGTGRWIGMAAHNHWRINVNNQWCLNLATLMHEAGTYAVVVSFSSFLSSFIDADVLCLHLLHCSAYLSGHTLGLSHSGEDGDAYGDISGFMGYATSRRTDWPRKCFNGLKNWQLGWYNDRHLMITDPSTPRKITLAAFVDYNKAKSNEVVVVNIADRFFLQYNRAKGFNDETEEIGDMVAVTENTERWSSSRGGLDLMETFEVPNFEDGKTLVVQVCEENINSDEDASRADAVVVSIGLGTSYCSKPLRTCKGTKKSCEAHDECCGRLRCMRRFGKRLCRFCRRAGYRCRNDGECCSNMKCSTETKKCIR